MLALLASNAGDLDRAARAIVASALAAGSLDNLTCQIVAVDHPGKADLTAHLQTLTQIRAKP